MAGLLTNSFTLTVLPIATETIPRQATSLTLLRNPTKPLTQSKRQSVRGDRLRALLRFFPFSRKPSARRRHRGQGLLPLRAAQMYICAMLARAFPPCEADNFPFQEPSNSSPLRSRHNRPLTRIAPIGPREFSSLRSDDSPFREPFTSCPLSRCYNQTLTHSSSVGLNEQRSDKASVSPCFGALRSAADA